MSDQFGLTPQTLEKIKSIFKKHPLIERVILYGSRAKGTHKAGSDIDLTLIAPKMELSELLKIENELDDLLLPYKIDLSLFHKIDHADLIEHIERVGVEI